MQDSISQITCVLHGLPSSCTTGLKQTDDESNALCLAEMLRLDILPEGYIYAKPTRTKPGYWTLTATLKDGSWHDGWAEYGVVQRHH